MAGLASRLRTPVLVERRLAGRTDTGGRSEQFQPAGMRWAELSPAAGLRQAALEADSRRTGGRWIVTLRDEPLDGPLLDLRLRHGGLTLAVIGSQRDPARPAELQLLCEAIEVTP